MDSTQREDLLHLLKTLADEHRLTMVGLMSLREYTVTELAELLGKSEPTVSHHITKLHSAGLLNLRMAGSHRYYQINRKRLERFKQYAAEIETLPQAPVADVSDNAWIDALDCSAEDRKVLRDYTFNGRLIRLPSKEKKWLAVLRWLATRFEPDRRYTEKEVNAILSEINGDFATMRRYLIEYGFMRRERGGGAYWLAPDERASEA